MDSPNGLRENQADVHSLYLGTLQLLHLVRDSIRHHHLVMAAMENKTADVCPNAVTWKSLSHIGSPQPKFRPAKPYSIPLSTVLQTNLTNLTQGKGLVVPNMEFSVPRSSYAGMTG